ncbi:MAG TPA: hypothetical protein VHV83_17765, partial [Armatimonadota bacterium]|nr:hypothetical protein [Armatimonadota bacterium]
ESDVIKTRVQGMIRGMQIAQEKQLPNNGYEILLVMKVYGKTESLAANIDLPAEVQGLMRGDKEGEGARAHTAPTTDVIPPVQAAYTPSAPTTPAGGVTGLVVDCRDMEIAPSLYPKIIDQQGKDLWSSTTLSRELIMQKGMVGYYTSIEEAKTDHRVGDNPLVVKPVRLDGGKSLKTNIVLSPADADRLMTENAQTHFLDKLCVAILTDTRVR